MSKCKICSAHCSKEGHLGFNFMSEPKRCLLPTGNYAQDAKKKKPCTGSHNLEPACPSTSDPPAVRGPGRHSSSRLGFLTGLFIPKSRVETDEMKAYAGRLFARRPSPSLVGGLLLLTQHVLLGQCLWNRSWRQASHRCGRSPNDVLGGKPTSGLRGRRL